jgi:glycosyltransferase involved in cell wall biosynthesis
VVVLPGLAGNGVSRYVVDLAAAFRSLGVDATIWLIAPVELNEVPHASVAGVTIVSGSLPPARRYRYRWPAVFSALVRQARRADVVVAGWDSGVPLLSAYLAAKVARRPMVLMVSSHVPSELDHYVHGWLNRASRWVYPRADRVVCSSGGLEPVMEHELGVPHDRLRTIPSGIDVERTRQLAAEPPPDWLPEPPFVVGVGRLAHAKGFDLLIDAHAAALRAGARHKLVIMGQGELQAPLEERVRDLGVVDSVLLPGFVKNPFPVVARSSALCCSSRAEGWGLMVAEAVALGAPVISTDIPATSDILGDGRYGELIERDSPEAMADALIRHVGDPEPLRARARDGAAHADTFSVRNRASDYRRLLDELVGV